MMSRRVQLVGVGAILAAVLAAVVFHQVQQEDEDPELEAIRQEEATLKETAPLPASNEPEPPPDDTAELPIKLPPERLIGRWVSTDPAKPFTLALLPQEGKQEGCEGHTTRRVWRGWTENDAANPVALHLFYRPRAAEMNPEIPSWAREQIDDELEWRLDLEPIGEEFSRRLRAIWYRGEVRWQEENRRVSIIGDGVPLQFELMYEPLLQIRQAGGISLNIEGAATMGAETAAPPLAAMLQDQRFFISAYVPKRLADTIGPQLTVTFNGTESGASETLTLAASTPGLFGAPVRYTHQFAVSLGHCHELLRPRYKPPALSLRWFLDLEGEGACLDFAGKSGEIVEVSFRDAAYRFQWFESWVQAALAQQRREIEKQRAIFNAIVISQQAPPAAKEAARIKLRMIQNYDALMLADVLHDLHRVAIGDIYLGGTMGPSAFRVSRDINTSLPVSSLGLLFYTDAEFQRLAYSTGRLTVGSSTMWRDALAFYGGEDLGTTAAEGIKHLANVVWTLTFTGAPDQPRPQEDEVIARRSDEAQLIYAAVRAASSRALNDLAQAFFTGATFALYDGIANSAPFVANAVVLSMSRDHFGRRVNNTEYWLAAIGLGAELILTSAQVYEVVASSYYHLGADTRLTYQTLSEGTLSTAPTRRVIGAIEPRLYTVSRAPSGELTSARGMVRPSDLPASVPEASVPDLAVRFEPPDFKIGPASAAPPERLAVRLSSASAPAGPLARETRLVRQATGDYGANHALPTPEPDKAFQPLAQANADGVVAANYVIWRETGMPIGEGAGINAMREYAADAVRRGEMAPQRAIQLGMTERYPDALLDRYLIDHQLEVATLHPGRNRAVTALEVHDALEQGWTVQAAMDFGAGGKRAIIVEHVVMNGPEPRRVQAFDAKYGVTIDMDAMVFNRLLDRNLDHGNLKAIRVTDPDLVASARLPPPAPRAPPAPHLDATDAPIAGRVFGFTGQNHEIIHVKVGEKLGGGVNAQAFRLTDQPGRVLRYVETPRLEALTIDDYGRAALSDPRIDRNVVRGVEQYGSWTSRGHVIEIVEEAPQSWAKMRERFGGQMTNGQALAVEAAARELNKAGYAWLDNHKANFSFEQLPGEDRWRVVIFDPGGIVPAIGDDLTVRATNARALQGYNHNPTSRFVEQIETATRDAARLDVGQRDLALLQEYETIRDEIYPAMQSRIDFDELVVAPEDLLFQPSLGVEQPKLRQLYALSDDAFANAYAAHYGPPPRAPDH